ncbi:hypothetical protein PanWU01x14_206590 [Parasponia andersonii]|uniref:Ribosomal protein n=1 Tax=Parasponia andersonii TaxID=3476 RepID=A0A2P5BVJ7_PARAD|nr:hypothetical protein PanWU01x14_206590 [Parasponia andersonii]
MGSRRITSNVRIQSVEIHIERINTAGFGLSIVIWLKDIDAWVRGIKYPGSLVTRRKERMRSGRHGPYGLGHTRATMGSKAVRQSESRKIVD